MIAEIKGKISSSGSNLHDRLEDQLTGDVFGSLRYVPAEDGLLPVLNAAYFGEQSVDFAPFLQGFVGDKLHFWDRQVESEIDLTIQTENLVVGVEVKLHSGLSSQDQLEREAETLKNHFFAERKYLLFVARKDACKEVYEAHIANGWAEKFPEITLGYIGWEDVLKAINARRGQVDVYGRCVLTDIADLLTRKGFGGFVSVAEGELPPVEKHLYFSF